MLGDLNYVNNTLCVKWNAFRLKWPSSKKYSISRKKEALNGASKEPL